MKKFFTLCMTKERPENGKEEKGRTFFGPREETLRLLRQFARVYRFESKLSSEFCSFITN
ncbi:MAG: hypothetical protein LBD27_05320 [Tannerella sp.]|jgi:hypothetical protein|nr:hypothetical protein [Tannerella sp.]